MTARGRAGEQATALRTREGARWGCAPAVRAAGIRVLACVAAAGLMGDAYSPSAACVSRADGGARVAVAGDRERVRKGWRNPFADPALRVCRRDFRALCRGTRLGGGRVVNCLAEHYGRLSELCRESVSRILDRRLLADRVPSCAPAIERHCPDRRMTLEQIYECMVAKGEEVALPCRRALERDRNGESCPDPNDPRLQVAAVALPQRR